MRDPISYTPSKKNRIVILSSPPTKTMVAFSRVRRRRSLYQTLLSVALYTWTVLAFPGQFHLAATTSARGFVLPLSLIAKAFIRRGARRAFKHQTILEKAAKQAWGENKTEAASASSTTTPSYEEDIRKFLASKRLDLKTSSLLEQFHIQGWRWHTKSLARDAGRLHRLALKTNVKTAETLKDASYFVIGFNMMGLHNVEATLFFPWMKEKLVGGFREKSDLAASFSSAMDALETDRRTVAELGETISKKAHLACDTKEPESRRSDAIVEVANYSAEMQNLVQRMISIEDTLLVPAVGAIVPVREQKSFNNKVLLKLGLLDSRLHLVGMYDAVWEDNDSKEKELFQKAIPGISRQMIPRWKRKLYQPKTYMME